MISIPITFISSNNYLFSQLNSHFANQMSLHQHDICQKRISCHFHPFWLHRRLDPSRLIFILLLGSLFRFKPLFVETLHAKLSRLFPKLSPPATSTLVRLLLPALQSLKLNNFTLEGDSFVVLNGSWTPLENYWYNCYHLSFFLLEGWRNWQNC